ncbi:hypothetical protein OAN307_c37390 [Octadecabacter antarcticus 307]|uniref:Uncharacterized protein n=1 Tax=Octadecabacter antarcticus 307 TaxID=391626 RepID=M9RAH6_9RHOB|nr:hypothetical protein OAN307_c37390 [Octadecabacter antarcticus 307]
MCCVDQLKSAVIPDIRVQTAKLKGALSKLGCRERSGARCQSDLTRHAAFLSDFIGRGPDSREVIQIVRSMLNAGSASAVMGKQELHAIHFHTNIDGPL